MQGCLLQVALTNELQLRSIALAVYCTCGLLHLRSIALAGSSSRARRVETRAERRHGS
jgi:hypothetical protein